MRWSGAPSDTVWLARAVIGVYGVVALTFFFARRTEDGPGPGLFFKCCPLAGYLSCVFRCLERGTGMCTGGIVPHLDETQNRPFLGVSWAVFAPYVVLRIAKAH